MRDATRRVFLGEVGRGMLVASLGPSLATSLGLTAQRRLSTNAPVRDDLEALVARMRETPAAKLQPQLIEALGSGTKLSALIAAGALANARTFGGQDYEGYHAMMSLMPAYEMSKQLPAKLRPLPVLKVIYRNTARIQTAGKGRTTLQPIEKPGDGERLREHMRARDMAAAERSFAALCEADIARANRELQQLVQDDINVHRIVLAWRSWNILNLIGEEHAHTMLRQSVRFCVDEERTRVRKNQPEPAIRKVLPELLDRYELLDKSPGQKQPEDAQLAALSEIVFGDSRAKAAEAVAEALADGIAPEAVGEAVSIAANQLLLNDPGTSRVHGASVGVHASDAANAWRNVARVSDHRNRMASLVVAAYHTAGQRDRVRGEPFPYAEKLDGLSDQPNALLTTAATAIEARDQATACAAIHRYGELGHDAKPVLELMLKYAISEDGALHAEKYYYTVVEEFDRTRPAFRWKRLVALARVTASEYGEPAPGQRDARARLGV